MTTALSDYLESGLLHHIFKGYSFPKPRNIVIALCSDVPSESDTGETIPEIPSGIDNVLTGYSRVELGDPAINGDDSWVYSIEDHDAGSGLIKNSGSIVFNTALVDWGPVSGIAITDHEDFGSGNLLMYSQLSNPRIIYKGDTVKFDVTNLQIKFD